MEGHLGTSSPLRWGHELSPWHFLFGPTQGAMLSRFILRRMVWGCTSDCCRSSHNTRRHQEPAGEMHSGQGRRDWPLCAHMHQVSKYFMSMYFVLLMLELSWCSAQQEAWRFSSCLEPLRTLTFLLAGMMGAGLWLVFCTNFQGLVLLWGGPLGKPWGPWSLHDQSVGIKWLKQNKTNRTKHSRLYHLPPKLRSFVSLSLLISKMG